LTDWTRRCKQSRLGPFEDLARRLRRWKDGILAYFEYPITNAVSEASTTKSKCSSDAATASTTSNTSSSRSWMPPEPCLRYMHLPTL